MKVLMTSDAVGGVWNYSLELCAALRDHDVEVTLGVMGPRPSLAQRQVAERLDNVTLVEAGFALEWMPDPWQDVAAAGEWLMTLADAGPVDVVHLNGFSHAALSWGRPVICAAHSCVSSWWRSVHGTRPPPEWNIYRRQVERGLNDADRVIAPTQAFLAQLRSCYDVSRPVQVIHNGIASVAHDDLSSRLPIVMACGRPWDAAKNMQALNFAARKIPWRIYVAGGLIGPDGRCFSSSSMWMLGALPQHQIQAWLSRASVFVHPVLYEPFGLAVLEAAMAGCALALADIPTLRELWSGAAEFFDPRDSQDVARVLGALIADAQRRRELAQLARLRARRYSLQSMKTAYWDLYRALTGTAEEPVRAPVGGSSIHVGLASGGTA